MGIPEDQLKTWAKLGSVQGSSKTYNLIKEALEEDVAPYSGKDVSVFLQGSYGNETNIIGETDVDVVIQLRDCWQSDSSELNEEQKTAYKYAYPNATYGHVEFKNDVLTVLRNEYGKDVADVLGLERGLLADDLALIPGLAMSDVSTASMMISHRIEGRVGCGYPHVLIDPRHACHPTRPIHQETSR